MTNTLVGDVYQKIIEEVVLASTNDFEESGVGQATLNELKQAWQIKLSQRGVAQMPWDPKPEPVQRSVNGTMINPASGAPQQYRGYGDEGMGMQQPAGRVKLENGNDQSYPVSQQQAYGTLPAASTQQGGAARAQELVQERFGQQVAAAINQRPGGLALPAQQPKPQGLQLPTPQQYAQQQQQMMQARQQQVLANSQANAHIKLENESPRVSQGQFPPPQQQQQQQQQLANPSYAQTDGADDLAEWQAYYAQRRAMSTQAIASNDRVMRDQITALTDSFENGLMVPLDAKRLHRTEHKQPRPRSRGFKQSLEQAGPSSIPQLDGDDDDEDDVKDVKVDDENEDAINSDLDDPDDDQNPIGDDDDDLGDSILCTYDKVQRVKNKWKCTLKDGVLNTGGKEWLFHKGQGEFEW